MTKKIQLQAAKTGKITFAIVRQLPHDPQAKIGMKGNQFGHPGTTIIGIATL